MATKLLNNKLVKYLRESKEELEKVTWPSQKETINYSVIVIVLSVALGAYFGILDFILSRAVSALVHLVA